MKNKKRLVPWLIAAVIIAALAVIGKKLYDLMFGGSLAVTTEDLKNGIIACSPAIIFIVVVLIAALIVVVAAGKLDINRKLVFPGILSDSLRKGSDDFKKAIDRKSVV